MATSKPKGPGRPVSLDPASKLVTVKMTPTQHAKFIELGGSRWIKRLIDEYQPGADHGRPS